MNRDEVLAMKPGQELNALVAEKVMGYVFSKMWDGYVKENGRNVAFSIPRYSTDIAAAFEAEEIAIEKDPAMYVHALASVVFGYNQVQDISDIKKLCLLIHATPEQRCKAALLAVMDNETN